jgi:hypothetical protein
MKRKLRVFAVSLSTVVVLVGLAVTSTHAALLAQASGQDNSGNAQGKGKAKGHYKNGQQPTEDSTSATNSTSAAHALSPKELKAELDKRIHRVNTLDNDAAAKKAGLQAVAKETGVPVSKLQTQVKDYKVETAGLLLANEMAKATGKPAADFLKQRMQQNIDWDRIAAEHKFDVATVFPQFDRVQASMEAAQKKTKH